MDNLKDDIEINKTDVASNFPSDADKPVKKSPRFSLHQYAMISVGILILLLIFTIVFNFIFKAPSENKITVQELADNPKNSPSPSATPSDPDHASGETSKTSELTDSAQKPDKAEPSEEISLPAISSITKQAPPLPETPEKKRVELVGKNISEMFSEPRKGAGDLKDIKNVPLTPVNQSPHIIPSAKKKQFTLQINAASQAKKLHAYAKEKKIKKYHVYETQRNGQPWFVLLMGNYSSIAQAKKAMVRLPADIKAKKPWIKPLPLSASESGATPINDQKKAKK